MPKVSIITVAFNSAATIGDTLRSVADQTHADIEHIVVDGGSRDGTVDIVRQFGHVARCISERDRGIYDAMNKGLNLATGEVVGFLNSDDMLADRQTIAVIAGAFDFAEVDAIYGDLVLVDALDTEVVRRYWRPGPHRPGIVATGWMAPHPTFYVRRQTLLDSGGFDLDYRLAADFDLELRLLEVMKIRTRYLPRLLVRMRMGGATTSGIRNVWRGNVEAARSVRRQGYRGGLAFMATKVLQRLPQFLRKPAPGSEQGGNPA